MGALPPCCVSQLDCRLEVDTKVLPMDEDRSDALAEDDVERRRRKYEEEAVEAQRSRNRRPSIANANGEVLEDRPEEIGTGRKSLVRQSTGFVAVPSRYITRAESAEHNEACEKEGLHEMKDD
mmetsp:Transcript_56708/g.88254  ORF Transcript_56708/g.88254 Transcript_56708/m.88254 type:complete len:123 (+) Transcript_56708:34-402(+)